jgi:hypothetical protein
VRISSGGGRRRPAARPAPADTATDTATDAAPAAVTRRPEILDARSLRSLQRQAGNQAVAGLARTVQRAPLDPADDPHGYTQGKNVTFTGLGVTRREVTGLKYGLKDGFATSYTSATHKTYDSAEAAMTKEEPQHMAVVVMPAAPVGEGPVQVVLHFHGWGFRGGKRGDPFAGYTVAAGDADQVGRGIRAGQVRDVDQEHWEQQIDAVNKERVAARQPPVVAILAQGRGMSDFGNPPTFDYVQDVLGKVPDLSKVKNYTIIESAHSGGGFQLATNLTRHDADTADRGALPAAKAGHAGSQPADMVIMFDANGIDSVSDWMIGHVNRLRTAITAAVKGGNPDGARAAIAASPKFRGYFAAGGSYTGYAAKNDALARAIDTIPDPWGRSDSPAAAAVTVSDLFRFVEVSGTGVNHEHVISRGTGHPDKEGALADALRAAVNPASDRGQALPRSTRPGGTKAKPKPESGATPGGSASTHSTSTHTARTRSARTGSAVTRPVAVPPVAVAPAPAATTLAAPAGTAARGWKASSAAGDYQLTRANRDALAAQTPEQRAQDARDLAQGKKRLKDLTAAEKRATRAHTTLSDADAKELADLRALGDRVAAAQLALKRTDLEEIMRAAGTSVADWYADVQQGTFLNVSVRVHKDLAAALQQAEATLVADAKVNPNKLDAKALGQRLNMSPHASDMRRIVAAVGGSSVSMHTFGLAVDLNYAGNPYLGLNGRAVVAPIMRATSLVTGTPVDILATVEDPRTAYAVVTGASTALKTYLSFAEPGNAAALADAVRNHTPGKGEPTDAAGWLAQIQKDSRTLSGSKDLAGHTPPAQGFIGFDEAVVTALTGAGLTWGATYNNKTKDLMHFDLRGSGNGRKIDQARRAHRDNH